MQILDDSTDKGTRDLVDDKVAEWRERGVEVEVRRRTNRAGYKAGALHEVRMLSCMFRVSRCPLSATNAAGDSDLQPRERQFVLPRSGANLHTALHRSPWL